MLILPVIETESKMFETPFHLHFLAKVLFLKYRKYCDPYHMCICEKGSRGRVKKEQKAEVQKSRRQKGVEDAAPRSAAVRTCGGKYA
jgi:hypothetical protein